MNKGRIILISIIILLLIAAGVSVGAYFYVKSGATTLTINLNGEETVDLNLNDEYVDLGAAATYGKKDITNLITTSNDLDVSKVGTYTYTYTIEYKKKTNIATRTINVIDNINPEITLKGESEISLYKDDKYKELGFTALDNYDGDLTEKVEVDSNVDTSKVGEYTITYTVKDNSGNTAQAKRIIKVKKRPVVSNASTNTSTSTSTSNNVSRSGKGIPVLMYHFFYDASAGETGPNSNFMEIGKFEEQIKYLVDNNYYFPTWQELLNYINGNGTLPEKSIVITVDDGAESFFRLAVPVLKKYNVHATSFLITSWCGNLDQYRGGVIEFQSHSNDMHRAGSDGKGRILTISHDAGIQDLKTSQEICGNSFVFCYPFGHYSNYAKSLLKEAGFSMAVTTAYGKVYKGMDPYQLPRIRMSSGDTVNSFINKIK